MTRFDATPIQSEAYTVRCRIHALAEGLRLRVVRRIGALPGEDPFEVERYELQDATEPAGQLPVLYDRPLVETLRWLEGYAAAVNAYERYTQSAFADFIPHP